MPLLGCGDPVVGPITAKISKDLSEIWQILMPNFTPIREVLAEKTMTEQKTQ